MTDSTLEAQFDNFFALFEQPVQFDSCARQFGSAFTSFAKTLSS